MVEVAAHVVDQVFPPLPVHRGSCRPKWLLSGKSSISLD
jgi:hypothetical protein